MHLDMKYLKKKRKEREREREIEKLIEFQLGL
jgi:hypothetical protein